MVTESQAMKLLFNGTVFMEISNFDFLVLLTFCSFDNGALRFSTDNSLGHKIPSIGRPFRTNEHFRQGHTMGLFF